jgi:hypothetical protein
MPKTAAFVAATALAITIRIGLAQRPCPPVAVEPLELPRLICGIKEPISAAQLRQRIEQDLSNPPNEPDPTFYFCTAERMKRVGDYRAHEFYDRAIQADDSEPNYELFYADYLRNIRGAGTPLFPQAEEHYFKGEAKIRSRGVSCYRGSATGTKGLVDRGLIALYQLDGLPLAHREQATPSLNSTEERPFAFFATIDRYNQSPSDLDQDADVRDYTSEALYAESQRNFTPLNSLELTRLIRMKKAFETYDRVRFRYKAWPTIDVIYNHRQTDNAQITHFSLPNIDEQPFKFEDNFNELRQNDFGVRAQLPLDLHHFDADLMSTFRYVQRWGLIEGAPGAHENIPQLDLKAAVARFVGPDKANLELTYSHQWIQPAVPAYPNRPREFLGATVNYQIFRDVPILHAFSSYDNRFATRGLELFGGFLLDNEAYFSIIKANNTFPKRRDYFAGSSLKGMLAGRLDLTLRPTWFTSNVGGVSFQKNSQLRGELVALFRLVDEEKQKGIPALRSGMHLGFLHLVGGFRKDGALTGPDAYANNKWGIGIDSSFYSTDLGTTYLLSARYDRERYFQLNRNADIFTARFSIGF